MFYSDLIFTAVVLVRRCSVSRSGGLILNINRHTFLTSTNLTLNYSRAIVLSHFPARYPRWHQQNAISKSGQFCTIPLVCLMLRHWADDVVWLMIVLYFEDRLALLDSWRCDRNSQRLGQRAASLVSLIISCGDAFISVVSFLVEMLNEEKETGRRLSSISRNVSSF